MPLAAASVGPRIAAPLMLVVDFAAIATLVPGAWHLADRREVAWLTAGVVLGAPLGAALLVTTDPLALRWLVAAVILALLALAISGWRLRAAPTTTTTVAVGGAAGVLAGVAMVPGPAVMAWLLGRGLPAARLRAVFNLFLAAAGVVAAAVYAMGGFFTAALLGPLLVAGPAYGLGIWVGTKLFGVTSETAFRRVCYGMIAISALLSLPVLDAWLR